MTSSNSEKLHRRGGSLGNHQEMLPGDSKLLATNRSPPHVEPIETARISDSGKDETTVQRSEGDSSSRRSHGSPNFSQTMRPRSFTDPSRRKAGERKHKNDEVTPEESDETKTDGDSVFLENTTINESDEVTTPSHKSRPTWPSVERSQSINSGDDAAAAGDNSSATSAGTILNTSREDRSSTLLSDMSGSCSTLQNERQDGGEMESSTEQSNRQQQQQQQMSVSFRQELLNVCQVKAESRIGLEVNRLVEANFDLVQLLARCLPHIVPIVPLTKREVGVVIGCGGCGYWVGSIILLGNQAVGLHVFRRLIYEK